MIFTGDKNNQAKSPPVVLTIAGSDSGGGAGIQADLKTFEALGVFGTSAIACVTAQNPSGVLGMAAIEPGLVTQQIRAVCDVFSVAAAKTGMLYSADIIRAVAAADIQQGIPILVVDPVMVAASGATLLQDEAIDAFCSELLPLARLITPNLQEAEILWGHSIHHLDDLKSATCEIGERFDTACVIKGGHLPGDEVVDFLYDEGEEFMFASPRLHTAENHGAGCAFSAAITAYLARGELLCDAVGKAKAFVRLALSRAVKAGNHRPLNFSEAGRSVDETYR